MQIFGASKEKQYLEFILKETTPSKSIEILTLIYVSRAVKSLDLWG